MSDESLYPTFEPFLHLQRSVPVEVEIELGQSTRLIVSSVEIWTTMVVIHSAFVGPPSAGPARVLTSMHAPDRPLRVALHPGRATERP